MEYANEKAKMTLRIEGTQNKRGNIDCSPNIKETTLEILIIRGQKHTQIILNENEYNQLLELCPTKFNVWNIPGKEILSALKEMGKK